MLSPSAVTATFLSSMLGAGVNSHTGHVHGVEAAGASTSVLDFFRRLFHTDFVPRGECVSWLPEVVWLHVFSDAAIALAYYSIPAALLIFVRRRRDLVFSWMYTMFAAFILACGTTHVMGVLAFWQPLYRLDGVIKLITALLSIATAATLWLVIPRALAIPSPAQLRLANARLEREIDDRQRAESELKAARADLEVRVSERTEELEAVNRALKAEVEERRRVESILRESDERFRLTLQGAPIVVFNQDRDLRYTWIHNAQFGMSQESVIGRTDSDLFSAEDAERLIAIKSRALYDGQRQHQEVAIGRGHDTRYYDLRIDPLLDADSQVAGITGVAVDVSERRRAEEHKTFLLAELDHRVKNNLASILALADESIRTSASLEEFQRAFTGRVRALAKTHAALAAARWAGVELRDVIFSVLQPYLGGSANGSDVEDARVRISGPVVHLSPKAASVLCLAMNELGTNAAKYGAFSAGSNGRVDIEWTIGRDADNQPQLDLRWSEHDGPPVQPPTRRGLGSQLIEDGAAYELGGHVRTEYHEAGVQCHLQIPLNEQNTRQGRFEVAAGREPNHRGSSH
jgi:PAS domain S-box-containing protein